MSGEVADGAVRGEVVEGGEGDVVFVGEGGEGEVRVEDAGGGVVFAGVGWSVKGGFARVGERGKGREVGKGGARERREAHEDGGSLLCFHPELQRVVLLL